MRRPKLFPFGVLLTVFAIVGVFVIRDMSSGVRRHRLDAALVTAVRHDDLRAAKSLLMQGADPNARDYSLVHVRVVPWYRRVWNGLLSRHTTDPMPPTLLMVSTMEPVDPPLFRALLLAGADPNAKDDSGMSTLMCAVVGGDPTIVHLLQERGVDLRVRDDHGDTALSLAAGERIHIQSMMGFYSHRDLARSWVIERMLEKAGAPIVE